MCSVLAALWLYVKWGAWCEQVLGDSVEQQNKHCRPLTHFRFQLFYGFINALSMCSSKIESSH